MWYWLNLIGFAGFVVSIFYGILALSCSDDDITWSDVFFVVAGSLFSWSMALAFFVGYNKNKDKNGK